jgi:hypothetical protein
MEPILVLFENGKSEESSNRAAVGSFQVRPVETEYPVSRLPAIADLAADQTTRPIVAPWGGRRWNAVTQQLWLDPPPGDDDCHKRKKDGPVLRAAKIRLLSVDNNRSAIMVDIPVVITMFDNDGFVAVLMIAVADDVTVAVPVAVSVTLSNRYANRTDPDPNLFSSSRHRAANSNHGGDRYGISNHFVLLSLLNSKRPIPRRRDRSLSGVR